MRRFAFAPVVVLLVLSAPPGAAAQLPTGADPQAAVGPRYEPLKAFYARNLCAHPESFTDRIQALRDMVQDVDVPWEAIIGYTSLLSVEQRSINTLIADARVQDPGFQCYFWDFSPPEPDSAGGR